MKPRYLYHGSGKKLIGDKLLPKKANDLDEKNIDNSLKGIYASSVREEAIAMALFGCSSVKGGSLGMQKIKRKFKIISAIIYHGWPKQKYIYLYVLPSETFQNRPRGSPQWVSSKPVKPKKLEKLLVADYIHLVRKATKKEKIEWSKKHGKKIKRLTK